MMINRRLLRLLACALLCFSNLNLLAGNKKVPSEIHSLPQLIERDRSSVVRITCLYPHSPQGTLGTGFFVNKDGLVVTAFHVVNHPYDSLSIEWPQPSIMTPNGTSVINGFTGIAATVVAVDVNHDLVLLKPEANPLSSTYKPVPFMENAKGLSVADTFRGKAVSLETDTLQDGEPIFTSGYPLNMGILITTAGIVSSSSPVDADIPSHRLRNVYFADMHVNHGNSGGPLFSAVTGKTVGMIDAFEPADVEMRSVPEEGSPQRNRGESTDDRSGAKRMLLQYNSGIGIIVPAADILEFLKRNGVVPAP